MRNGDASPEVSGVVRAHPNGPPLSPQSRTLPVPSALLLDLDGTLYRGGERIPGADRLIAALVQLRLPCWFVTNNSSRTPDEVSEHLNHLGIPAAPGQVVTSAMAAADYAGRNFPGASAYVIGEKGLRQALEEAGLQLLPENGESLADVVVQGIDRQFTYAKLASAVRNILNGAAYLLTNPDLLLPMEGGLMPGAGSLAASLRAASGREPVVIGKPSAILMDYALRRANAKPDQVWVVGDNPETDIAAAARAGCPSVLTLTGLCSEGDWEARCRAAGVSPGAVCAGLDELESMLRHSRQST